MSIGTIQAVVVTNEGQNSRRNGQEASISVASMIRASFGKSAVTRFHEVTTCCVTIRFYIKHLLDPLFPHLMIILILSTKIPAN
jgi:hypothetical protein